MQDSKCSHSHVAICHEHLIHIEIVAVVFEWEGQKSMVSQCCCSLACAKGVALHMQGGMGGAMVGFGVLQVSKCCQSHVASGCECHPSQGEGLLRE